MPSRGGNHSTWEQFPGQGSGHDPEPAGAGQDASAQAIRSDCPIGPARARLERALGAPARCPASGARSDPTLLGESRSDQENVPRMQQRLM